MITFLSWWFAASIVAAFVNYVIMHYTDYDNN